jgi:hypothetical protein
MQKGIRVATFNLSFIRGLAQGATFETTQRIYFAKKKTTHTQGVISGITHCCIVGLLPVSSHNLYDYNT